MGYVMTNISPQIGIDSKRAFLPTGIIAESVKRCHYWRHNFQIRKMIQNRLAQFVITALLAGFLASCGSKPSEEAKTVDSVSVAHNAELLDVVDKLLSQLPRPSEIPNLIAMTGAEFESKLLNPVSNAEKVTDNSIKAAFNVGVFAADIGYMAAYGKGKEAFDTFLASKKLADKIGVSAAFDPSFVNRIEKNLANKDSVVLITSASLDRSPYFLRENQQLKDAAMLSAGAFVEGLYLTCALIHDYPPTGLPKVEQDKILVPLVNSVIKQEAALGSLIELIQKVNDGDPLVADLQAKLEKAKAIYAKANWPQKLAENKGDLIPTEKDIHELAEAISALRNEMVQ